MSLEDIVVDGSPSDEVKIGNKSYQVLKLLIEDLRSVKCKDSDKEGKKQRNSKDEQKNILGGRSPGMSDTSMMREWFEICRPSQQGLSVGMP